MANIRIMKIKSKKYGRIVFDSERYFGLGIFYPKYFSREFAIENSESLNLIFKYTVDKLMIDLLKNADKVFKEFKSLYTDENKIAKFYHPEVRKKFEYSLNKVEKKIYKYNKNKTAFINVNSYKGILPHDIQPGFRFVNEDFSGFTIAPGGFCDYVVDFRDGNNSFASTKDFTFEGCIFTIVFHLRFLKNIDKFLLNGNLEDMNIRRNPTRFYGEDKEYSRILDGIYDNLMKQFNKNKSKRIDTLKDSMGLTVLQYAKLKGIRGLLLGSDDVLEVARHFGKPLDQVKKYLKKHL